MSKPIGVTSLSEFCEELNGFSNDGCEYFYRGHSKTSYNIEPSIYRACDDGFPAEKECLFFKEFLIENPHNFLDEKTTLEKLVLMQHSGIPTRLLDVTTNPLVALYFCCANCPEDRGEVVVIKVPRTEIHYFDSDIVSVLANLSRLTDEERDGFDISLPSNDFNESDAIKRLLFFVKEEKPFFRRNIEAGDLKKVVLVKTKKSNPRIIAQSGAFLLYGLHEYFQESKSIGGMELFAFKINAKSKGDILKELDRVSINEQSLFPELDKSAQYIKQKVLKCL